MERELARIKGLACTHVGSSGNLLSALHEIVMDGPRQESDLVSRAPSDSNVDEDLPEGASATALCKDLCRLWLERHGRRFQLYKERKDKNVKRGRRLNSESALAAAQAKGRSMLCQGEGEDKQLLGISKSRLVVQPAERSRKYRLSDALKQFRRTTELRKQQSQHCRNQVSKGLNHYPVGDLRVGNLFRGSDMDSGMQLGRARADLLVVSLCKGANLSMITGARLRGPELLQVSADALLRRCQSIKLLVVETWSDLDHLPHGGTTHHGPIRNHDPMK